jgi:hypothetical protein
MFIIVDTQNGQTRYIQGDQIISANHNRETDEYRFLLNAVNRQTYICPRSWIQNPDELERWLTNRL